MHVLSVLDSLVNTQHDSSNQRENWATLESIMARSPAFFHQVEDVTLLAMLLERVVRINPEMETID